LKGQRVAVLRIATLETSMVKPTCRLTLTCFVCCIVLMAFNVFFPLIGKLPRTPTLQAYEYPHHNHQLDLKQEAVWSADPLCLSPSLPYGQFEIVVGAGRCSKPGAWDRIHGWVGRLGLPRVIVHIYWREHGCDTLYSQVQLPCGMQYEHHVLLPNMGNEAASYAEYIRTRYDSLPRSVAFVHEHGPAKAWHSHCELFYGRMTAYYRGLQELNNPSSRYGRLAHSPMVSLAGGCGPSADSVKQGDGIDSVWIEIISQKALCSMDRGAPRMNWTHGLWRMWQDLQSDGTLVGEQDDENRMPTDLEALQYAVTDQLRGLKRPIESIPSNKETSTYNRCDAAVSRVERCPYPEGCNKSEGPGSFWSCCNSYIVSADALRLQPKRLFEVFQSQCCFPKGHMSSASGRVMEYRAYAWFNGSEPSPGLVSDMVWATKAQRKEVLKRGCEIDDELAPVDNLLGFEELMSIVHGYK